MAVDFFRTSSHQKPFWQHLRRICVIRSRLPGPRAACSRQTETQTPRTNRKTRGAKSGKLGTGAAGVKEAKGAGHGDFRQ